MSQREPGSPGPPINNTTTIKPLCSVGPMYTRRTPDRWVGTCTTWFSGSTRFPTAARSSSPRADQTLSAAAGNQAPPASSLYLRDKKHQLNTFLWKMFGLDRCRRIQFSHLRSLKVGGLGSRLEDLDPSPKASLWFSLPRTQCSHVSGIKDSHSHAWFPDASTPLGFPRLSLPHCPQSFISSGSPVSQPVSFPVSHSGSGFPCSFSVSGEPSFPHTQSSHVSLPLVSMLR